MVLDDVSPQVKDLSYPEKYLNNMDGSKCFKNIHGSQKMNPTEFGDPLTFPLVPSC